MTAPAYGGDDRATGTAAVQAEPAPRDAVPLRGTGHTAGRATVRTAPVPDAPPLTAGTAGATRPTAATQATQATRPTAATQATRALHPTKESRATTSRELSSTSAVGLVLAGGAILVIAGQLLRLRLRLRRERRGDADER
ncbi:hypothetical protein [Streptomyces tubercidicus]|nr:hypothetical protein [Streptomyces tubercidicus]WAU13973.1 hypothetical protein STRTU_004536 [Streptomyces tubercidicus]